jgi:integrase
MEKLYNQEIKEKFLSTYGNEQTQNTIRRVFYKSELIESVLEKDLYAFNLNEIGKVISNANPYSSSVAMSLGRFISQYISWAMPYRNSNLNPLQGIPSEWYDQFVDKTKKIHFSYDEMLDMVEHFPNSQDQALIWMIFEGVMGKNFSELRHLKYDTVNWNTNELTLYDEDYSKRIIKVSNRCMRLIKSAYEEEIYRSPSEKNRDLVRSDFILRNVTSPRGKSPDISKASIYNRIYSYKQKLGLEYYTPNGIRQSGQIKLALDLYKEYGKLEYEQFEIIGKQFNTSMITNNGYTYYNSFLMREYINPENIKNLYGINLEF